MGKPPRVPSRLTRVTRHSFPSRNFWQYKVPSLLWFRSGSYIPEGPSLESWTWGKMLTARPISKLVLRRAPLTLRHGATNVLRAAPTAMQRLPLLSARNYSQKPPGGTPGGPGGFPGFNMFGQQQEKGDALKQYVSVQAALSGSKSTDIWLRSERGPYRDGTRRETGSNNWSRRRYVCLYYPDRCPRAQPICAIRNTPHYSE